MATFPFVAGLSRGRTWDDSSSAKYRLALLETQLVKATVEDILVVSGLTLDEPDDASYARVEVTGRTINVDNVTNHRVEYLASQCSFSSLAGAETIVSGLIYFDPDGTDTPTTNVPIIHLALTATVDTDGNNLIIKFNDTNPGIVWYDSAP